MGTLGIHGRFKCSKIYVTENIILDVSVINKLKIKTLEIQLLFCFLFSLIFFITYQSTRK